MKSGVKNNDKYVLILASGGIDSTACINFYKKLGYKIELLFIDYGQKSRIRELESITAISQFYDIRVSKAVIQLEESISDTEVKGRNATFLFTAAMIFKKRHGIIALGIHAGTQYYDCSDKFLEQIQLVMSGYFGDLVIIDAPFKSFNKGEIYQYCKMENVPLQLTYSCELGKDQPCGKCSTCKDLQTLYASQN